MMLMMKNIEIMFVDDHENILVMLMSMKMMMMMMLIMPENEDDLVEYHW